MTTLETERLTLRPFRVDDAEAMFRCWANDPEVTKYLTWIPHENAEKTRALLENWTEQYADPERLNFAIELKPAGELIGGIDVVGYTSAPDRRPVIGYVLGRKHWGRGYMTEALRRLLDYLFSLGFTVVDIEAMPENIGSNRVIQKCGGVFVGTGELRRLAKNDVVTVNRYEIRKQ